MPRLFPTTTVRLLALAEMLTSIAEIAIRIPVAVTAIRLLGETPSSPGAVSSVYGYMFAMVALPCVLFVGAFGHLVDSSPHTRLKLILRGTVFGRVVTTAGLVAIAFMANRGGTFGVVPLFVILFADFTLASLFEPALHRLVPGVVDERHLSRTNASLSFSGGIGYVVGPIIGGFLTEWSTPGVALLVSAILYGFSGILLTRLLHTCAIHIPPPDKKALTVPWHDLFWQSGTIGWVLGSYSMMGLTAGLVSGIVPAIVASHVGPSVSDLGAVWTASGLGTLMGGTIMLAYTEHIHTLRTRTLLALLFGGSGIAFIFAGELHGAVCVITAMFVVSFLATPTKAIILTHIQRYANKIAIGRVVAMVSFGYWLGYMLGASGAGQLVERYGLTTAVTCVVVGRLVSAALGSRTLETQKAELSPAILQ